MQFSSEVHVGFVEGHEEEREDLVDFDEEEGGFLVEFCGWGVLVGNLDVGGGYEPSHSTLRIMRGDRILYHRYIIQITHRELISPSSGREMCEKLGTRHNGWMKVASGRK